MSRTSADVRKEQKQRPPAAQGTKKNRLRRRGDSGGADVPPQPPQDGPGEFGPSGGRPPKRTAASTTAVGRDPRVDLLPKEVHVDRRARATARRAWLGVVVVAVVTVLLIGGATVNSVRSGSDLKAAQDETNSLLLQQQKYSEVRDVERQSTLIEAGQQVGGSTEIDWQKYLTEVQGYLPSDVAIGGLTIDSAVPMATFEQAKVPLQGERVATVDIKVVSASLPSVPDWTERLSKLRGYVDSTITTITKQTGDGATGYRASITLHINEKAYDDKYAEDK
ncbi:hypothetical protein [Curtobacterium sp. RRHDQ10]|uniref:hypothetical protein n=1 Tax=Curtobacterium phyllosphaerae TaxID=3413379 RepID=UPI003BEFA860